MDSTGVFTTKDKVHFPNILENVLHRCLNVTSG